MLTLEIVRLALIKRSPDLSPLQYVALILAFGLHITNGIYGRIKGLYWRGANLFVWLGLAIVCIVKVVGLVHMWDRNPKLDRAGGKYPLSDQVLDISVMAGLYVVLALLELGLGMWRGSQTARLSSASGEEEEMVAVKTSNYGFGK
jgi:hypothetical protein